MEILNPGYEIIDSLNYDAILKKIEQCGRVSYKSEDRITPDSAEKFVRNILKSGHESVIEHHSITIKFICDRGVSHELVRHRIASFTQESTRYVNYTKKRFAVIKPPASSFKDENDYEYWKATNLQCEKTYFSMIDSGHTPEQARMFLPTCLKTELVVTANLREWRHILQLRTARDAHPQMREIMIPLLAELTQRLPVFFEDIVTQ
ncbi:MAG TPA: FAD-dependent thymidylate synthase [Dehalococcoidia bacterium]|nr:FAD-dependent thymidylate synthase [Dehalococcoidia bacterium]